MHNRLRLLITLAWFPFCSFAAEAQDPSPDEYEFSSSTVAAFDHSGKRVTHQTLPNGTVLAEHNGTLGHVMVARVGADGRIETFCTEHEQYARNWMALRGRSGGTVVVQDADGDQP
ncbi:MAG: hypothetical protein WBS20_03215 [Lysobacterales bacterium]